MFAGICLLKIDWGNLGSGTGTEAQDGSFGVTVEDGVDWGISLKPASEVRSVMRKLYYWCFSFLPGL